ncbi:hypothetical protein MJ1_0232 [Nanobdella aerobiophila]|uniref:Uncharacterized protein n=1 Tax=Nanobdella aerobiophila TaxID=2586965 RepID=A0A915SCI0_9ARCH|nr:exosortase/archaeosortase family protein [Nanobdella aerobiophila]BBL45403.1 hypothetical protein MJ1_0232 [Nanobdella aerobiophila]
MFEYIIKKYFPNIIEESMKSKMIRKELIIAIFFLNMLIYSIPLSLFSYYYIILPQSFLLSYSKFIGYILTLSNIEYILTANTLHVGSVNFIIDQECTGFKSVFAIFAMIFSTPILNIRNKIMYFIYSSLILYILNIFRLWSVFFLYVRFNLNPYFVHNVLWEIFTTMFLVIFWIIFIKKYKKGLVI